MSRTPRTATADEGIALLLTVFVMLLVASMSLIVGTVVLRQVKPTQYEEKSTRTVNSAEAGFDVALNRIRAAQNAKGEGLRTQLPCTATEGTVLAGPVGPGTRDSAYSVTIRYYAADPTKQPESWRSNTTNLVSCQAGSPSKVPAYALLESTGSGAALPGTINTATRVLEQTYRFRTTNANIPGGRILNNKTPLCLTADSHQHNAQITVRTCEDASLLQKWAYTPQLLLKTSDASNKEFCIENMGSPLGLRLTQNCDSTKASQIWSFNDYGRFEGATANANGTPSGTTNGWCFTVLYDQVNGSEIVLRQECSKPANQDYDSRHTFNPEASVGAGAASDASAQLVNFQYFGRCLDITSQNQNSPYLIAYPCKQAPNSANILWNQKFFWDVTTEQFCSDISNATVRNCSGTSTNLYCLQAGTVQFPPSDGTRVLFKRCVSGDNSQKWTRRYKTQTSSSSYNILTKVNGLCLDLNPSGASEAGTYEKAWGVIQVSTCNGSNRQKWNAPADLEDPATINTYEHER
jgi:hypothetical protein